MTTVRWRWLLAAVLAADVALTAVLFRSDLPHREPVWYAASLLLAGPAVLIVRRCGFGARAMVVVVVGAGFALQCAAFVHGPLTSSDVYRYVWDGHVQLSGVDPYHYAPSSPAIADLRVPFLFGPDACAHPFPGGCTAINRPTVTTIYPPVAEAAFVLLHLVAFGGTLSYQLAAGLGTVAVALLIARILHRAGRPLWPVAIWSWCPLIVTEYGNNAHIDWLAVLLSVLAVQAAVAGRDLRAGLWAGAAVSIKLYPALLVVALARRRPWVTVPAALAVFVLGYVPHVLAVGSAVVGYLPGYLHEEGYESGGRFLLLGAVFPHPVDTVAGVLVVLAAVAWTFWRADPTNPARTGVVLVGVAFLVATPTYGWYAGLLLALAVLGGRLEWALVAIVPTLAGFVDSELIRSAVPSRLMYVAAALVVVAFAVARRRERAQPEPSTRSTTKSTKFASSGSRENQRRK